MTAARASDEPINLGIGHPDPMILPLEDLGRAAAHAFACDDRSMLEYSPRSGGVALRARLAERCTRIHGADVSAARLFLTAGASEGLDLVVSRFTRPGDTVLVEDPTYFAALRVLEDRHVRIVPVPTDEHGL